ncbi:MAG: YkgJ family cysteine cluster protein [Pseudomonadales bacterium]|nr:YkgJ family cysteine cluster protein [Pseudomonadales bacterium]
MKCRVGCGACCIAPSITTPIPGMPAGKLAGVRCVQLDDAFNCKIFGEPHRPKVCSAFHATPDVCGTSKEQAMELIARLEISTL